MDIGVTVLIMLICLATEAFFSGSEIAVVSADRIKLRHEAAEGSRGAKLALAMLEKPEWLLSTTLVGTNIAVVTNTTVATALMIHLFGEQYSWLAIVILAPLIWIFGEIVAKSIFQQRADVITPKAIFLIYGASFAFYPLLAVFAVLTRGLGKVLGGEARRNPFTLREEIVAMMEMSAPESDIRPEEQTMIRRVFDFGETTAGDILVPLIDVVAIEREATCGKAVRLAVEKSHRSLPVYAERVDRIVGTLDTLDLLQEDENKPIEPFIGPVRYVPRSKSVESLLLDLRREHGTMAVVVDEFGGAEGIVMLEDILEEVVGEIEDEFDRAEASVQWVRKLGSREYLVSGRIELETLEEKVGIKLPEGNYETLAGFLIELAKEIPPVGKVIRHQRVSFVVERATEHVILEVRVRW